VPVPASHATIPVGGTSPNRVAELFLAVGSRPRQNDRRETGRLTRDEAMAAKETPATRAAIRAGVSFVVHEYEHDPGTESYALEAAAALGIDPARVFKTLVVTVRDGFAVCIVPSDATLDLRSLGKHAALAPVERAERVTGRRWDQPARSAPPAPDLPRRQRNAPGHGLCQRRAPWA